MAELPLKAFVGVGGAATILDVMAAMRREQAPAALVSRVAGDISAAAITGIISKEMIADAPADTLQIFSE